MTSLQRKIIADVLEDDYMLWEIASWSAAHPPAETTVDPDIVHQVRELIERGWAELVEARDESADRIPVPSEAVQTIIDSPVSWAMPTQGGGRYWLRGTADGQIALEHDLR